MRKYFCMISLCIFGLVLSAPAQNWQWSNEMVDDTKTSWDWTSLQWPSTSKFSDLKLQIDKEEKQGQLTSTLLSERQKSFEENPKDPEQLFKWAYSSWAIIGPDADSEQTYKALQSAFAAMRKLPPISDYEYIRLRFLVEAIFSDSEKLSSVGARLLQFRDNDYEVEYQLSIILSASDEKKDNDKALYHAKHLLSLYPHNADVYYLLGSYYLDQYLGTSNLKSENAKEAVVYYEKFLELASKNNSNRGVAEEILRNLKSDLKSMKR